VEAGGAHWTTWKHIWEPPQASSKVRLDVHRVPVVLVTERATTENRHTYWHRLDYRLRHRCRFLPAGVKW
jgi:hypothetical protein